RSLLGAYAGNQRAVTPAIVSAASAEALGLEAPKRRSLPFWYFGDRRRWSFTEVLLVILIAAVWAWWWLRPQPAHEAQASVPTVAASAAPASLVAPEGAPPETSPASDPAQAPVKP